MLRQLRSLSGQMPLDGLAANAKLIAIAAAPFLSYLLVFKYYAYLREVTGMSERMPPNAELLPWLEESIFQCQPHRIFSMYASTFLDVLAAIPYLVHFPLPVLFGLYLAASPHRRRYVYTFYWVAGWVNLLAVVVQFLMPTAPPWFTDSAVYDEQGELLRVAANEAGFERLDTLFDIAMFKSIYGASPVKFGAMPSLHVAWPAIILVSRPWISMRFAVFHLVWIIWAALYSNHHYGVDAMGGIMLTLAVSLGVRYIYNPFARVERRVASHEYIHGHLSP